MPVRIGGMDGSVMDVRYLEIMRTMHRYFDGLYTGDTALLETVFHPQAHYVCATGTPMVYLDMRAYFAVVAGRTAPAALGEARRDDIESIEFAGPATAFVRAHCTIGSRYFTDFLALILADGRWQIISKVFHYVHA